MISDPIADLLTRIRNAQAVNKKTVQVPYSKTKEAIVKIMVDHSYLGKYKIANQDQLQKDLIIDLKYSSRQPAIDRLKRISKLGVRVYVGNNELNKLRRGRGITIISTSKGIITAAQAKKQGLGGEVICKVS